jgi:bifunctional UDP-N-acetylglucosamine pyrophosphorylase/glucosamine-1-phosphate N-acetyltransferase
MSRPHPIVLIMAAGLGTRMKSEHAKVLHEVAGRPMIAWAVETARAAGAERVVAILGHQFDAVKAMLDGRYGAGAIDVALQAEPKGTGHAVLCALPTLEREADDRIVVILSGDAPLLRAERVDELVAACAASPAGLALLSTVPDRPMPYGRLVRDAAGVLQRIVEHADASEAERAIKDTNAGFYAVRLGHLRRDLATLKADNAKGELYLTDLVARAAGRGGATAIDASFEEVSGRQRPRRSGGGRRRRAPADQRGAHAVWGDDGRSGRDLRRRRRRPDRRRRLARPGGVPARRRHADRPRARASTPAASSPTSRSPPAPT